MTTEKLTVEGDRWKWREVYSGGRRKCVEAYLALRRGGAPGARVLNDSRQAVKYFDRRTSPHKLARQKYRGVTS